MAKDQLLSCNIGAPGTPFVVKETIKDSTFLPGTRGFISRLMGPDYEMGNIGFLEVVTVRKGKTGKSRLVSNTIMAPVFQLPEDKYLESLVPIGDEALKYLVDLETEEESVRSMAAEGDDFEFLGWLLAKTKFVKALSDIAYSSDNRIMRELGIGGRNQANVWVKPGQPLNTFLQEAEHHIRHGEVDHVRSRFCTPEARAEIIAQLRLVESKLIVPRIEYQRRVMAVLKNAVKAVRTSIGKEKSMRKDEKLIEKINSTGTWVKSSSSSIDRALALRIKRIAENRHLLKL